MDESQFSPSCAELTTQFTPGSGKKNPHTEVFKDIIRTAGIILSSHDLPNVLTQEQSLVYRNISNAFIPDSSLSHIKKFLNGFKLLIKKEKYFRKALLASQFKKANIAQDVNIQQESLFRILLNVRILQPHIIEILINEITSATVEENQDTSWLRLLLNQLRYLAYIENAGNLTSKILDILEIAAFPSQLEILDSIPEILPDSEHAHITKKLSELLLTNEQLDAAIIDCLNACQLDATVRAQIQDHILSKILTRTSSKVFPIFLDFLLAEQKLPNRPHNLQATFIKIRNALDAIMGASDDGVDKEKASNKIIVLQKLQSLITSKAISEAWLGVISNIKLHSDHKPIDVLILLILHSSGATKKRTIELIFRKRIKEHYFKCSLLEQLFAKCLPQQIIKDHFISIVEIGSSLLRTSTETNIAEFASTLFCLLFNHKYTETAYRQELLDSLILLTNAQNQKNISVILNVFITLLDDITRIQHHTVLLMRLLERLDAFELKHVKQVFEILCRLTCSDESLSGMKQEIHMIIRKQLSSSKRAIKHRGIIGAVVMAKHIATTGSDQIEIDVSDDSILTVGQLRGEAHEAASILELAHTSTIGTIELLGLYFDELTAMLRTAENLDKYFLTWLFETVTNDFQNLFVTEPTSTADHIFDISMQYNLNTNDEVESPISINIAELCLVNKENVILQLAPHFRLLRVLHAKQQNGDLSSIDALLGCGISLPNLDLVHNDDFPEMKRFTDCVFHCINWFREVISAFVCQKSRQLRYKTLQRLDNLIEFESLLAECLGNVPEHRLPLSHFDHFTQPTKQSPRKETTIIRINKKAKTNETTINSSIPSTSKTIKPSHKKTIEKIISFREIDIDFIVLLQYQVSDNNSLTSSSNLTLTIPQLSFILKDFVSKLDRVIKNQVSGLSHLGMISAEDLIKDCVKILPNLRKHFNYINERLEEILSEENGSHNADAMFTDRSQSLKAAFGLILEALTVIVSWTGFQHTKHFDLLRDILKAFRVENLSQATPSSVQRLIVEFVAQLSDYEAHCLQLGHAVYLVQTMEILYTITPNSEIRAIVAKTSHKLLLRRWYNANGVLDTGKVAALMIDTLLKSYLSNVSFKELCSQVGALQSEAQNLKAKSDNLQMLASIDKGNFYIFYRNLWHALHNRLKVDAPSQLSNREQLTKWRTIALTMQGLMTVVKAQETKSNLVCYLKKAIAILKIFLSQGIPVVEAMLKPKPDQVVEVLKTIQASTRFLHHLCCQSKLTKDSGLLAYVPQFRLTLETLLYRVKAALVANGCSDAFWMGNLRNRDLHGHDILSQSSTSTTESEIQSMLEEDEEVADCEEDEDIFGGEASGSASEVFD